MGCCGKDLGPVRACEMPSEDDMARFGNECECDSDLFEDELVGVGYNGRSLDGTEKASGKPGTPVWAAVTAAVLLIAFVAVVAF